MKNIEIIEKFKKENNIDEIIHTYSEWNKLGFKVKKGQKAKYHIVIWRAKTEKYKLNEKDKLNIALITNQKVDDIQDEGETLKNYYKKLAHFFTFSQVERIAQ